MSLLEYRKYHRESEKIGDIDPSFPALIYLCDRFELNIEQRYWLALLYSTCYCVPTVYYLYNEFPDYWHADIGRIERFWKANKQHLIFQTDRKWIKNNDQFADVIRSYREMVGENQDAFFKSIATSDDPMENYDKVFEKMLGLAHTGRYSLFLYTEGLNRLAGLNILCSGLDLKNAESSCNGLLFVYGDNREWDALKPADFQEYTKKMTDLYLNVSTDATTYWSFETTLCAYKKYRKGKRYIGYYIDRQYEEIQKAQKLAKYGVDWNVLYQFRLETYRRQYLVELGADNKKYSQFILGKHS